MIYYVQAVRPFRQTTEEAPVTKLTIRNIKDKVACYFNNNAFTKIYTDAMSRRKANNKTQNKLLVTLSKYNI